MSEAPSTQFAPTPPSPPPSARRRGRRAVRIASGLAAVAAVALFAARREDSPWDPRPAPPGAVVAYREVYRDRPVRRFDKAWPTPSGEAVLFAVGSRGALVRLSDRSTLAEVDRAPYGDDFGYETLHAADARALAVVTMFKPEAPPCVVADDAFVPAAAYARSDLDPAGSSDAASGARPYRWVGRGVPEVRVWIGDDTDPPWVETLSVGAAPEGDGPRFVRTTTTSDADYGPCAVALYDPVTAAPTRRVVSQRRFAAPLDDRPNRTGLLWAVDAARGLIARTHAGRVVVATFDAPDDELLTFGEGVIGVARDADGWLTGDKGGYVRRWRDGREIEAMRAFAGDVRDFDGEDGLYWATSERRRRLTAGWRTAWPCRIAVLTPGSSFSARPESPPFVAANGLVVEEKRETKTHYRRDSDGRLVAEPVRGDLARCVRGRWCAPADERRSAARVFAIGERGPEDLGGAEPPNSAAAALAWVGGVLFARGRSVDVDAVLRDFGDGYASGESADADRIPFHYLMFWDSTVPKRASKGSVFGGDGRISASLDAAFRLRRSRGAEDVGSAQTWTNRRPIVAAEILPSPDGRHIALIGYSLDAGTRRAHAQLRFGSFARGLAGTEPREVALPPSAVSFDLGPPYFRRPCAFLSDGTLAVADSDRVEFVHVPTGTTVGVLPVAAEALAVRPGDDELAVSAGSEVRIYRRTSADR
jgi:hypothetical protein